jgi:hypothetical protein
MISYQSIPFEVRLIIAQTSPNTWYIMVQVDPNLSKYMNSNKAARDELEYKFTTKVESKYKTKYILPNGKPHSNYDQPGIVNQNGLKIWYRYGLCHRDDDKPGVTHPEYQSWYSYGCLHRDGDMPAVIYSSGNRSWYKNGYLHRDNDLPASIINNSKHWYVNGIRHRDNDLPAIEYGDLDISEWYKHGKIYRKRMGTTIRNY